MGLSDRLRRMFRVKKPIEQPDKSDSEPHEHEWFSLGAYERDYSIHPEIIVACECGAWTAFDLKNEYRVDQREVKTFRMR